jgi:hypothetical protein
LKHTIWAILVAAALLSPSSVQAQSYSETSSLDIEWFAAQDPSQDIPLCVLLPYSTCMGTIDLNIGYGGGGGYGVELLRGESNDYMQLYVDAGYLFRVVRAPSLQIGPTVGFELEIYDETVRYHLFSTARSRIWAGPWVTFELALGLVASLDEEWNYRGFGGMGEFAITLHGHLGVYVQGQLLAGLDDAEARLTAGVRGSFLTWLAIFAGMFA